MLHPDPRCQHSFGHTKHQARFEHSPVLYHSVSLISHPLMISSNTISTHLPLRLDQSVNPNFTSSCTISSSFSIFCSWVFSSFSPLACRNFNSSIARNFLSKARCFLRSSGDVFGAVSSVVVGTEAASRPGGGAEVDSPGVGVLDSRVD